MIEIIANIRRIKYSQWMSVYEDSNRMDARKKYAKLDKNAALLYAQQDHYSYLKAVFFQTKGAGAAAWIADGVYTSALRYEPFLDGFLITALETAPNERRKGYALKLLSGVVTMLCSKYHCPVYAHIDRRNKASFACHQQCGFTIQSNEAVFLDGSHHPECSTVVYVKE